MHRMAARGDLLGYTMLPKPQRQRVHDGEQALSRFVADAAEILRTVAPAIARTLSGGFAAGHAFGSSTPATPLPLKLPLFFAKLEGSLQPLAIPFRIGRAVEVVSNAMFHLYTLQQLL